jgi:Fur family transcriptional regulator, ferric uptake regulator
MVQRRADPGGAVEGATQTVQSRATRQRATLLSIMDATPEFRSAQELHRMLCDAGTGIGLTTVYRAMQQLVDAGEVDMISTGDEKRYRRCRRGAHHHHLVCRVCGTAREVRVPAVERAADKLAADHGFTDIEHTLEIFGRCPGCAAAD